VFPRLSVTLCTCALESLQPIATTLRFPAVCAPEYASVTDVCGVCGTA
jgi:hypothetical protein